ncbi:MAG: hypothetical protein AB8B53_12905 [Flavobacteriales bacterium]
MKWLAYIAFLALALSTNAQDVDEQIDQSFFWPKSSKTHIAKPEKGSTQIDLLPKPSTLQFKPSISYALSGGVSSKKNAQALSTAYLNTGFELKKRNLSLKLRAEVLQGEFGNYMSDFIDSTGVISGFSVATRNDLGYLAHRITGNVNWQISRHFNAEIGNSAHFWGNGHRSLVLGNNAAPYPYLKLTTDVWRIKYVNLFSQQRDFNETLELNDAQSKYTALHAIDFKVSESFSLTLFEAVVWQSSDTLSNRGFEANYLNPIIFYRPVEFSQGSADNVLLGLAGRLQLEEHFLWYGQMFLDEFLLSAVREGSGWWANKVGLQIGVQAKNYVEGLTAYSEFNLARPFTYTHGSARQSYGHLNQSLAHPLGTNFMEWSSGAEFNVKKWRCAARFNWAFYGRDRDGDNYGGNVFRSYASPLKPFGNYIGQGNTHHSYFGHVNVMRPLTRKKRLWMSLGYVVRHVKNSFNTHTEHQFRLGLASNMSSLLSRNRDVYVPNFVQDF